MACDLLQAEFVSKQHLPSPLQKENSPPSSSHTEARWEVPPVLESAESQKEMPLEEYDNEKGISEIITGFLQDYEMNTDHHKYYRKVPAQ